MEAASPAAAPPAHTTQSTTIADMFGIAAEHGVEHVFVDLPNPV